MYIVYKTALFLLCLSIRISRSVYTVICKSDCYKDNTLLPCLVTVIVKCQIYNRKLCTMTGHWRRNREGGGEKTRGSCAPHFFIGGQWYVCTPPPPHTHTLLTPHFHFPLELYVYITLTNNYLAFFIYQLIILWTISIN